MRIAVITPTIPGREVLLQECVQSVSLQTRPADLHAVRLDRERIGLVRMRNEMIAALPPEIDWLAFLDDDDIMLPQHLKVLSDAAWHADIVYPDCRVEGFVKNFEPRRFDPLALQRDNYIPVTVLMRRALFDHLGGFRVTGFVEDWDMWKRAATAGARFEFVPEVTWVYRRQPNGLVMQLSGAGSSP